MAEPVINALMRIGFLGQRFWSWWTGELRQAVPNRLRQALDQRRGRCRIEVLAEDMLRVEIHRPGSSTKERPWTAVLPFDELDDMVGRQPILAGTQTPVDVVFSSCFVLDHVLRLPSVAKGRFGQAVALQLERVMPLAAEAVYCASRKEDAGEVDQIKARVCAIRRVRVDQTLHRLTGCGVRVRRVLLTSPEKDDLVGPISGVARPVGPGTYRGWAAVALSVMAVALFASSLTVYVDKLEQSDAVFRQQISEVKEQAERTVALRAEFREWTERTEFLRQELERPSAARILALLTAALPDEAWVSEFQLQDGRIRLAGTGQDPGGLIGRLEAMPMFEDVRLMRVSGGQGTDRGQRFEASMVLAETGGT